MVFDECPPHDAPAREQKLAVERTIRWARECREQPRAEGQKVFGIVQGGSNPALREECAGGKCVVTTWLGPWMAPGQVFRVWLDVPEETRAQRLAGRENISSGEALTHIQKRDSDNRERYKKVYGIDIFEQAGFDLVIDAPSKTAA